MSEQTLEQGGQRQRQAPDANGEEQQKANHKHRPPRHNGLAGGRSEEKIRGDDGNGYVPKGEQALSNVHSRTV